MAADFQRVAELFEEARSLDSAQARDALLSRRCVDAPELRTEVEDLLAVHARLEEEDDALGAEAGAAVARSWMESQGEVPAPRIEGYEVGALIGTGGMGAVYEAREVHPPRRVALKVIRPEMATAEGRARFTREVELLARLQHPGIVPILASGHCMTSGGSAPYLVLEYIDGRPITDAVRDMSLHERVRVLLLACEAVAHAHRRGVIHRDLKPSNILVDSEGRPRVLDFGLALAVNPDDEALPRHTRSGHFVGTLGYASPAQAAGRLADIDTRCDVYSLGAVGYEMLTGRPALDIEGLSLPDALGVVLQGRVQPARELPPDLEQILRSALAHDPSHRYESASALAGDLRRYLENQPITARPPSTMYHARMFVRRNRVPVAAAAAVALALIVGLTLALASAKRADQDAARARLAAAHAHLVAAASAQRAGDPMAAADSLRNVPPPERDWAWHHLRACTEQSLESAPYPAGFTGEEAVAASAPPAGWEERLRRLRGHGFVYEAARGAHAHRLRHLDGAPAPIIDGLEGTMTPLSPPAADGLLIAVEYLGAARGHVFHGLVADEKKPRWSVARPWRLTSYSHSHAAGLIIEGDGDGNVLGRDAGTGADRWQVRGHSHMCSALAWSSDGSRFASAGWDGYIKVWATEGPTLLHTLRAGQSWPHAVALSADGTQLAAGGERGTIRVWEIGSSHDPVLLAGHRGVIRALRFDKGTLESLGDDGWRRWDLKARVARTFRYHTSIEEGAAWPYVYAVAFSQDGSQLASGAWDDTIRLVDVVSGRLEHTLPAGRSQHIAFDREGRLYTSDWSVTAWHPARWSQGASTRTRAIPFAMSPTEDVLFAQCPHGGVHRLRLPDLDIEHHWTDVMKNPSMMACTHDGGWLLLGNEQGDLAIHDARSGRLVRRFPAHDGVIRAIAVHPSQLWAATGGGDTSIRIWDLTTGALRVEMTNLPRLTWSLAFHPGGRRLASGGQDGIVRVWDTVSGLQKLSLHGHRAYVKCVAFSPDGTHLASASGDGTVRVWSSRRPEQARNR